MYAYQGLNHRRGVLPVNESSLSIQQVELIVEALPGLGDGGGVGQHAERPRHGG